MADSSAQQQGGVTPSPQQGDPNTKPVQQQQGPVTVFKDWASI